MTSEQRPAVDVWDEARRAWHSGSPGIGPNGYALGNKQAAVAVIEAYGDEREAKARAEQAAELAKWKALAETLAGDLGKIKEAWDWWQVDTYDRCSTVVEDAINEALTSYKEQRDA